MTPQEIKVLAGNTIFSVVFTKKDGSIRNMTCRLGVTKYLRGGRSTTAHISNILTVEEIGKERYRNINTDNIISMKIRGKIYNGVMGV